MKVTKFIIAAALLTSYESTMTMFSRTASKKLLQKAYSVQATPSVQKTISQTAQYPVRKFIGGSLFLGAVITAGIYTEAKRAQNDFDSYKTLESMKEDLASLPETLQTANHAAQEKVTEYYTHIKNKIEEVSKK